MDKFCILWLTRRRGGFAAMLVLTRDYLFHKNPTTPLRPRVATLAVYRPILILTSPSLGSQVKSGVLVLILRNATTGTNPSKLCRWPKGGRFLDYHCSESGYSFELMIVWLGWKAHKRKGALCSPLGAREKPGGWLFHC